MRAYALIAAALCAAPAAADNSAIVRHSNPDNPKAIILSAVTIPPGAETLMLSGVVPAPINASKPADSIAAYGDTRTQTLSVLNRIKATLAARGYAMSDIVRLTVYLVGDPAKGGTLDFEGMNTGYREFFGTVENPNLVARSTVQVAALASPHYLVEIEATAARAR